LPHTSIPIARGPRYAGQSRMRPIGLVLHGLSAMFVYGEVVGARLLVATLALTVVVALVLGTLIALRLTNQVLYSAGLLAVILLQAVLISLVSVFNVIGSRAGLGFLPVRDCAWFVRDIERVFVHRDAAARV